MYLILILLHNYFVIILTNFWFGPTAEIITPLHTPIGAVR